MLAGVVAVGIGAACLVAAALAWSGRWRSWSRTFLLGRSGALPITLLPGIGAALLTAGLNSLGAISTTSPVSVAAFIILISGIVLFLFTPRWWGPRWYRSLDPDAPPDLDDPATAMVVAQMRAAGARDSSMTARSNGPAALGAPLQTWRGSWIAGDESLPAAHGLTHPGAVSGHLELYRGAVSFVASRTEDMLRETPTVLTIDARDVRDLRVVPRGAGTDGLPTPSAGPRSLFPRLVVDTEAGPYLFEVQSARRTARRIGSALGLEPSS